MKIFFLVLLALARPAAAADRLAVRLYSLHKFQSIEVDPGASQVLAGERRLNGKAKITARGSGVSMDGGLKLSGRTIKLAAYGEGVWLSGNGLPRRFYRGTLEFSSDRGLLRIINDIDLETYLAGVVSGEAGDLSKPEAYKAQAVAARTYTTKLSHNHSKEGYNLCDSTHCQLYRGQGETSQKAREAVYATRGQIVLYEGKPASTFYHSACGGRTEDMAYVWPFEKKPYLISVSDTRLGRAYCAIAPGFRWRTKIYFTGLTRIARSSGWIGAAEEARGLRVSDWGPSGRAYILELYTKDRRIKVSVTDFYHAVGRRETWQAVKSAMFKIIQGKDFVILDGVGSGHGVGLCQWGAEGMARKGFGYKEILKHYYPGTEISDD